MFAVCKMIIREYDGADAFDEIMQRWTLATRSITTIECIDE